MTSNGKYNPINSIEFIDEEGFADSNAYADNPPNSPHQISQSVSRCQSLHNSYQSLFNRFRIRSRLILILIIVLLSILLWICFGTSFESKVLYGLLFNFPTHDIWGREIYRIGFEGDSLCLDYLRIKKVMQHIENIHTDKVWSVVRDCYPGSVLNKDFPDCPKCKQWAMDENRFDIISRVEKNLVKYNPKAIFLLWDSDATDLDEGPLRGHENTGYPSESRMTQYIDDLTHIFHSFQKATEKIVVMSPALFGEAPRGKNGRDGLMDTFENITRSVCDVNNVSYFDLRAYMFRNTPAEFFQSVHLCQPITSCKTYGHWTVDGEHFKERTEQVVVDVYISYLDAWFPPSKA